MYTACDQQTNDNHNSPNHSAGPAAATMGNNLEETETVTVRKCGETLYNTVSKVATAAIECTKGKYNILEFFFYF